MIKKVLITGASGLLGQALVKEFLDRDFLVAAQYHTHRPVQHEHCRWLKADFSDLNGIRDFLQRNREQLVDCGYLINNYGPITSKPLSELRAEDFYFDFHHNVVTAFEVTSFLIKNAPLQGVINVGFEFVGQQRAYRKILTYAAAKNALLLMTRAFQEHYPHLRFRMVSPPTLEGASVRLKNGKTTSPGAMAREIYDLLLSLK